VKSAGAVHRDRRPAGRAHRSRLVKDSCHLRGHRPEVGVGKRFANDRGYPLIAETANERMAGRHLLKQIDRMNPMHETLPGETSKPPALLAVFNKLGACDGAPCLAKIGPPQNDN
jgi:hypothetical protein